MGYKTICEVTEGQIVDIHVAIANFDKKVEAFLNELNEKGYEIIEVNSAIHPHSSTTSIWRYCVATIRWMET